MPGVKNSKIKTQKPKLQLFFVVFFLSLILLIPLIHPVAVNAVITDLTPLSTYIGEADGDLFGLVTSFGGDVNGDGYNDILITADNNDSDRGEAYIFFGGSTLTSKDLSSGDSADLTLRGESAGDLFGCSGAIVPDINNDGYDDVIIGAKKDDDGGLNSGTAFIFFGGSSMNNNYDVKLIGEDADDRFGDGVGSSGEINNDGVNDVVVGAPYDEQGGGNGAGAAYIFYGSNSWSSTIDATEADVIIIGKSGSSLGQGAKTAGDINGDGINDLIIAAPMSSPNFWTQKFNI